MSHAINLQSMLRAYLACALWADLQDENGEPLDHAYDASDIAEEDKQRAADECAAFVQEAGELLSEWDDEQAGHDFWLTRQGHGAGFWDRGKRAGAALTKIAKGYSPLNPYVGDDHKVYMG